MKCPKCGEDNDKVLDSRAAKEGSVIRRRRECLACGSRFTTHEEIDRDDVYVIKRDGRRELFMRDKLEKSVRIACQKRPVSEAKLRELVDAVADAVTVAADGEEVPADRIGQLVMERMLKLDEVAYIRFASVYRRFADLNQFMSTITEIIDRQNGQ